MSAKNDAKVATQQDGRKDKTMAKVATKKQHKTEPKDDNSTSPHDRWTRRLVKMQTQLEKAVKSSTWLPRLHDPLANAKGLVTDALEYLASIQELPAKPSNRVGGWTKISDGEVVKIRETRRDAFKDLLDPEEMEKLTVVKSIGSRLKLQTENGTSLVLPRAAVSRA